MLFYNHQSICTTQMRAAGVNRIRVDFRSKLPLPQSMVIIYKDVQDNRYLT